MSDIIIYHNPACGTSRNVLAMIRHSGVEPTVIEYLKNPPTHHELQGLLKAMNMPLRDILRRKGTPYDALGLDNPNLTDEQIFEAIAQHPVLIQRPIVVTPLGTRLCRPSEAVLDILPGPMSAPFTKEDGTVIQGSSK